MILYHITLLQNELVHIFKGFPPLTQSTYFEEHFSIAANFSSHELLQTKDGNEKSVPSLTA